MPYSLIVLVASVGLLAYFVFATEATAASKTVVAGLYAFSFYCMFRMHFLVGLFLLVALNIYVLFYRVWYQAHLGE